jgi:hypothetical protein
MPESTVRTRKKKKPGNRLLFKGTKANQEQTKIAKQNKEAEMLRDAQGGYVHNFWFDKDEKAAQAKRTLILLDHDIDSIPHVYKDEWWVPSEHKFYSYPCVEKITKCPVCDYLQREGLRKHRQASLNMYLTVLDLKPYTDKDGNTVKCTKRLLEVKFKQQQDFKKMFADAIKAKGTIRGLRFALRYSKDTGAPKIGRLDAVKESGGQKTMWTIVSEAKLVEKFGNKEKKDSSGKVLKKANTDITPYNYELVFPEPDIEKLKEEFGVSSDNEFTRQVDLGYDDLDEDLDEGLEDEVDTSSNVDEDLEDDLDEEESEANQEADLDEEESDETDDELESNEEEGEEDLDLPETHEDEEDDLD